MVQSRQRQRTVVPLLTECPGRLTRDTLHELLALKETFRCILITAGTIKHFTSPIHLNRKYQ